MPTRRPAVPAVLLGLALDQGMVMAALGNELTGDRLQRYLTRGAVERVVRPLLAMEEFTAGG